jgi:hypothetical protein
MSYMAVGKPDQEPVYFANWGLRVWKRIFTRSRGPTTVFAWGIFVSLWFHIHIIAAEGW